MMPSTLTRVDTDDNFGWSEITTTFDDDGAITATDTTYDTGATLNLSYFADGYVDPLSLGLAAIGSVALRADLPVGAGSVYTWDSILTYYSLDTPTLRLFERTVDDTGLEKSKTFDENGNVVRIEQIDHGDVKAWESVVQTTGPGAHDSSVRIIYDTGDIYEKTEDTESLPVYLQNDFTYGRTITREDVSDTKNYVYKTTLEEVIPFSEIDPTQEDVTLLIGSETMFDDGVLETFESHNPGFSSETHKSDTLNAYDWDTISIEASSPQDSLTVTTYDDGSTSRFLTSSTQEALYEFDVNGEIFKSTAWFFYESGQVSEFSTSGVDQIDLIKRYSESGTLTEILELDHTDVRNFEYRISDYDEDGVISARTTVFDNGLRRIDTFTDGVRSETVLDDLVDVYNYETRVDHFDAAGNLTARETVYDDGIEREETYIDGQRVQINLTDTLDVKSYETSQTSYELQDDSEIRTVVYDNGRTIETIKESGVTRSKTEVDGSQDGASYNYVARLTTYDEDGNREQLRTELDQGDHFVFNYTDNELAQRLEFDGNESHDWTFKVTDYDAGTSPVVTYYDSFRDAPNDVLEDFGFLTV